MMLQSLLDSLRTDQSKVETSRDRDLKAIPGAFDLKTLIASQVVRGSDNSAPERDLEHKMKIEEYTVTSLTLKA